MHQLQRQGLHLETTPGPFFSHYFGEQVLQKLERPAVGFSQWPAATRNALHALCLHFAVEMPEADHVIRADVDTPGHVPQGMADGLLMYFGWQGGAPRGQYTGVGRLHREDGVVLVLYVAGSSTEEGRERLVAAEDPAGWLEGRVITSVDDVNSFAREAAPVLQAQRRLLKAAKTANTSGFCPAFCQKHWNQAARRPEPEAAQAIFNYWTARKKQISPVQAERERHLFAVNNGYRRNLAVQYVRDHLPVDEAYSLAISEHA